MADIRRKTRPGHKPAQSRMRWRAVAPGPSETKPGEAWTYRVRVCGFTFQFVSLAEVRETLEWFTTTLHPSSRIAPSGNWDAGSWTRFVRTHHYEAQRWHERLPAGLTSASKRKRVVAALRRTLAEFGA